MEQPWKARGRTSATENVQAVYITGSLLREGALSPFSDIDVAAEGLEEEKLYTELQNASVENEKGCSMRRILLRCF